MSNNFICEGRRLTYNNAGAPIASGAVVRVGNLLAVAQTDIPTGASGELGFGVYRVPKVSGAVIAQGETLVWDASAGAFDDNQATPATGDVTGPAAMAWVAAGNGATQLEVMFTGAPGTVA